MGTKHKFSVGVSVLLGLVLLGTAVVCFISLGERKPNDLTAAGERVWAYARTMAFPSAAGRKASSVCWTGIQRQSNSFWNTP